MWLKVTDQSCSWILGILSRSTDSDNAELAEHGYHPITYVVSSYWLSEYPILYRYIISLCNIGLVQLTLHCMCLLTWDINCTVWVMLWKTLLQGNSCMRTHEIGRPLEFHVLFLTLLWQKNGEDVFVQLLSCRALHQTCCWNATAWDI